MSSADVVNVRRSNGGVEAIAGASVSIEASAAFGGNGHEPMLARPRKVLSR
jgi:hypothetical protein